MIKPVVFHYSDRRDVVYSFDLHQPPVGLRGPAGPCGPVGLPGQVIDNRVITKGNLILTVDVVLIDLLQTLFLDLTEKKKAS